MVRINDNFAKLRGSYLFSEIAKRVDAYKSENPTADVIRLGIGDVTKPIIPAVTKAMHEAVDEMATASGFHGYGPEQGYSFLRELIVENDYAGLGIAADEVFVSDGAKCDTGNFQELLDQNSIIAVTDPVYPVYVDSNVMAGRSGEFDEEKGCFARIVYLPASAENDFVPSIPTQPVDVVYLCSPNNPTGTALKKSELTKWVDWANENGVLILFDAAYERFVTQSDVPRSIYEIPGAERCAVEFRSFSKTAGFTGTRCAFTVVPKALLGKDKNGKEYSLNALWNRRQTTKFNGVSYAVQKGAAAIYTREGKRQVDEVIAQYLENAKMIREGLQKAGMKVYGGVNSPYIWLKTDMDSWEFFDKLLREANVVGTPGAGFGAAGQGYFRLTAFNTKENTQRAVGRIVSLLTK